MSVPVTGPPGGTGGTGAGGGSGCGVGGGGELVGSAAGADVAGTLVATMLLGPAADEKADGVPRVDGGGPCSGAAEQPARSIAAAVTPASVRVANLRPAGRERPRATMPMDATGMPSSTASTDRSHST
jgi:hypothetical protein